MKCKRCIHQQAAILDNKVAICATCWLEMYGDDNHNNNNNNNTKESSGSNEDNRT
jgi:hypothetical protein